ncbi:MAG: type 1 glutamine amidotransferase [Candidatus Komeilibacteria bacterium]|nr:type 1 glutamine amidotransferase [Candidatus Komeilibacteria bacterium]
MTKRIVIILETDFRDEEAIYPFYRLQEDGFVVEIATDQKKQVLGKFGVPIQGTITFQELNSDNFDGVIIPGGNEGPDRLRMNQDVLNFIRDMHKKNKLIAAICHGVWVLISAKIIKGKKSTCYRAIIDDLENAGGIYLDNAVVIDNNIITSRHPRDLAPFAKAIVDFLKIK